MQNRDTFNSKIGIVAAAAGSAIGLGNIWKFPYMAGKYGGSAFIIIYLLAIVLMGYPLICAEFAMGQHVPMLLIHLGILEEKGLGTL